MKKSIRIIPAFGRDYKTKTALIADWSANKDFRIADMSDPDDGRYVNAEQVEPGTQVFARFAGLAKQCVFRHREGI